MIVHYYTHVNNSMLYKYAYLIPQVPRLPQWVESLTPDGASPPAAME